MLSTAGWGELGCPYKQGWVEPQHYPSSHQGAQIHPPRSQAESLANSLHAAQFHGSPQSTHKPQKGKTARGPDASLATGKLPTLDHRQTSWEQGCPTNPQAPTSVPVGPRAAGDAETPKSSAGGGGCSTPNLCGAVRHLWVPHSPSSLQIEPRVDFKGLQGARDAIPRLPSPGEPHGNTLQD